MYDQEKIKKMKNHELAMEAYFYAYNHKLFGGASQKKAIKCYEQIIAIMDPDERINLDIKLKNGIGMKLSIYSLIVLLQEVL